ncbi:hypothetical protein GCM10029976_089610 [Kribbella albertanoniae]|uniref:DUF4129 domain-containing protein n=1 Tax=Kribbella albertanoniae TaxID=1266829 RepID=A0A4R4PQD1_9ACTN|nr:DUF4129 domain-containing protein [Kribbella albertanoniae]TDC24408.1 DUF4129 domain-containing protein [Kribbella albertanoniae]
MRGTRRGALVLTTGLGLAVIVVLAASSGTVHPFSDRPPRPPIIHQPGDSTDGPRISSDPMPDWFDGLLNVALVMLAVLVGLAVVWALYAGVRMQRDKSAVAEGERVRTERLAEAVATSLAQVDHGTPDDAVIACWVALEQAAAAADLNRRPAETSTEFTARVFSTATVSRDDLDALADLYREARYSTHASSETDRSAARAVLHRLQDELVPQRSPVGRVIARVSRRSTSAG